MAPPHRIAGGTSTLSGRSIYTTAALCETPWMERVLPRALLPLFLMACSSGPTVLPPPAPELVEGEGVYVLRHNPPPCLRDRAELAAELDTPLGWERVAIEDASAEVPVLSALQARFREAPRAAIRVRGVVTDDARPFGDGHAARVLRLVELDPPEPATEAAFTPALRGRLAAGGAAPAGTPGCARPAATGTGP